MTENISPRAGWAFVLGSTLALAGLWHARTNLGMAWAGGGIIALAIILSIAALIVILDAWLQVGGGSEREFHGLSDIYAMVIDAPWWTKAIVVLSGVAWALV